MGLVFAAAAGAAGAAGAAADSGEAVQTRCFNST